MIEAVRTTASPAMIWTIVVVMSIFTAILTFATMVADAAQRRQARRVRMTLLAPGPELGAGDAEPYEAVGAGAPAAAAAAGLPSQRTSQEMAAGQSGPRRPDTVPRGMAAAGAGRTDPANPVPAQRQDAARQVGRPAGQPPVPDATEAPTEPIPATRDSTIAGRPGSVPQQGPRAEHGPMAEPGPMAEQGPVPQSATARGRHARGGTQPAEDTAQGPAGGAAQAGDSGRHAMPAQRSGEADRAERSFTGPANPDPEDPDQP